MKIIYINKRKFKQLLTYFLMVYSLALILLVLSPIQTFAAVSDFRYCAPIAFKDSSSSYNLLELTDAVLGQTKTGLPDLRIYSGEGEIPYALVTEQDFRTTAKAKEAEIINRGKDAQGNLQFEVLIPASQVVRQLTVISPDKNFIRKVKVEGSHDQQDWLTMTEDNIIFDLTNEQKGRHMEVNMEPSNFSYLRITIFNEGKGTFNFEGISLSAQMEAVVVTETKERPYNQLTKSSRDGVQEYTFDLLQPNLPSGELEIVTNEVNFNRSVELYACENNKDWNLIAQGEIFAYRLDKLTAKQLAIKYSSSVRYLKLKIHDQDNPQLNILAIKIKGSNPLLVMPADRTKETMLYWGSNQMIVPVYDIQKFKGNLDYSKMPRASLGHAEVNKVYQYQDNRPWTERNSWLLRGILIVVTVALLVIIIQSIRKISSEKP